MGVQCPTAVIGDTHGQYHDVLRLIEVAGEPGEDHMMIFNGDFIDRGAWGLELMTVLMAWKIALPHRVLLVRGNHESVYCAMTYGFFGEMEAKLGPKIARKLFAGEHGSDLSLRASSVPAAAEMLSTCDGNALQK